MRLQKGNRKLPKETLIWNLPAIQTCPGSTPECRKHCYARKAERVYPNVLPFRENNFELARTDAFKGTILEELYKIKNWNQVRIHESGDFFNQKYFDDWNTLAYFFPDKIFYAYTKNKMLDLKDKCKNLILIFSDDKQDVTIKELKEKGFNGTARVTDNKLHNKFEKFCDMSCKECDYCYTKPNQFKRIVFPKH